MRCPRTGPLPGLHGAPPDDSRSRRCLLDVLGNNASVRAGPATRVRSMPRSPANRRARELRWFRLQVAQGRNCAQGSDLAEGIHRHGSEKRALPVPPASKRLAQIVTP